MLVEPEQGNPEEISIWLVGIAVPGTDQPWGEQAKQALTELVLEQKAQVWAIGADRDGQKLARVNVGGADKQTDLNLALDRPKGWRGTTNGTRMTRILPRRSRLPDANARGCGQSRRRLARWEWRKGKPNGEGIRGYCGRECRLTGDAAPVTRSVVWCFSRQKAVPSIGFRCDEAGYRSTLKSADTILSTALATSSTPAPSAPNMLQSLSRSPGGFGIARYRSLE